nr:Ig-like domain-containing protein [Pseudomonas nitroreducens]
MESVIDDVAPITGEIHAGDSTNDPKPTFSGSAAEPNSTVNVYDNGTLIGSVKADADGKWTYEPNPKLEDGDHSIQFSDVDAAGNEGPKSTPFTFNVDTIAPTQSTVIVDAQDDVQPVVGAVVNGGYTNDTTPKLEGTISDVLQAGERVVVLRDGAVIGTATVDGTGTHWSYADSGLVDGKAYTYTARVEDAAGNRGAISADFTLNIDTSAPTQTVVISTIWDDVAPGIGDVANGGSTNDSQPELKGSLSAGLEKNEVLVVYRDGQKVGNASVNGTSWSFTDKSGLEDQHTYKYEARVEDAAGNTGSYSNAYSMTLELLGPSTTAVITAITDDVEPVTGVVANDGYTNDADPSLSGTISQALTAGQSVEVLRDGVKIGVAVVTGTTWTYEDHNLVDGKVYSYTAQVVDGAGNPGAVSPAYVIHVDLSAPTQTVVLTNAIDDAGDVTGPITNGGTTDDDTPTLNGTISSALSGTEQVHVFRAEVKEDGTSVPAKDIGVATVELKGGVWTWTYTDASLSNYSQYTYYAQVVDAAGNASAASNSLGFTLNTDIVAQAVQILSIEDAVLPVVGKVDNGGYTNDTHPTVTGSISMALAAGDKVVILRNGEKVGEADVTGTTWTFKDSGLANGSDYDYVAQVVNSAGNKSQESNHYIIHVDTVAPIATATIVNYTDDVGPQTGDFLSGSTTDDTHPKLNGAVTGTLAAGESVVVYRDGERLGVAALSADKVTWSYQDAGLQDAHTYTYTARVEDLAGNQGTLSSNFVINVDIAIPTMKSEITQITEDTGVSDHDFITQDRTLLISGKVESELLLGQKVQFSSDGGVTWKDATLDNDRVRWTYDNRAVSLADGTYTFETRVVSAAGSAGPIGTQTVVIDNSQPTNKVTFALDPASDNGVSNTDNITSIMTPTINGTVKSGSHKLEDLTITLFWDKNGNNQIDEGEDIYGQGIKVKSDGTWSTDLWSLHYGDYLLKAVATTASGVTGSASYVGSLDDQNHILTITQSVPQHYYGAKQAGFEFGWDVVNIGDFNGDGIDDLLVSARNSDTLGRVNNGGAWILFGSENGLPVLDQNTITNLKPSQGIFFAGAYNGDIMGTGINALGDFNGDGYKDVIISSHWPDKIYVIFGGPNNSWGNGTVDLSTIDAGDNTHGFVIRNPGVNPNNPSAPGYDSWNGIGVGGGGDFNGDGYTDLLFGNREAGPNNSGAGYVLYGGANVNKNIVMDWSNPATGTGSSQTWAHFPAGVNGTTITNSFTGTVTNSSQVNGVDLGDSINNVGDVNGDGIDDFVIADPRANNIMSQGYGASAGTAYLVYGKAGGLGSSIDLKNMTLDQGIRINSQHYEWLGSARQDYSTNTITALGDINGDGINDFAISAPYSEPGDPGRVWIIYGKAGGYTSDINLDALNTVGVPSQFNTNPMFDSSVGSLILNEKATYNSVTGKWTQSTVDEWFGVSIRAGGDINGDGINDFIIGARYADRPGKGNGGNSGAVYVVYGNEHGLPTIWSIKDVINDPTKGYALYGEGAGFELGNGVAMGDWNGDGMMDIATGAYNADFTATDSGAMYVYYSASDAFTKKYTNGDDYIVADGKDEHGNPVNDYIVGGFGNDTIVNIGTLDYANGGEGNDFIHIVSTDFLGVNGGSGTDTLVFDGQGLSINLAVMKNKVISFEKFDLGHGGNSLTVKLDDVLRMGESDLMFKDGKKQLVVNGDASGNVDLVKTGITWTESSATGNDGHAYKVYSSGTGEVWIEDHVQVHLVG